jgi:hypothetical protein
MTTFEQRFWAKVDRCDLGCWNWTGALSREHGQIQRNGKRTYAHRITYEWFKGTIPPKFHVDHLCRNPRCVNPNHLEAVSCKENTHRGNNFVASNAKKQLCKRGHEFSRTRIRKRVNSVWVERVCQKCITEHAKRKKQ